MWSSIPALPYGVYAHAACEVNGSIYITGGVTDNLSDPVPVSYHCFDRDTLPLCCFMEFTLRGLKQT